MKYFIDTEFQESGPYKPIELISIGIVREDGKELYLENKDYTIETASDWLRQNVVPHLQRTPDVLKTRIGIKYNIISFIPPKVGEDPGYDPPEFWGYFADYDWVVFCQLFGAMIALPKGYPMFCYDLMQLSRHLGVPKQTFPKQDSTEHHALNDARWNKKLYDFLCDQIARSRFQK